MSEEAKGSSLVRVSRTTQTKQFPNGDTYAGGWVNDLPDGEGVYKWADGSEYNGDWLKGQKHGVGRYRWPSGATYQGEWVNGMMQGVGTFEAVDGTMYAGSWLKNRKNGLGKKIYANQDCYEGLWKHGKAWGPGRYIWVDGNEYDGEWANGVMHGQGTFVWRTGERYDGEWKCGLEDGQGLFTWSDSSVFDGFWSRGRKHGVGLYRTSKHVTNASRRSFNDAPEAPDSTATTAGDANGDDAHAGEGPLAAPRLDKRQGESNTEKLHAETMYVREYERGRVVRNTPIQRPEIIAMLSSLIGETQAVAKRGKTFMGGKNDKIGETINSEHRSYELMKDLQLGIRWSVSKMTPTPASKMDLDKEHFAAKVKVAFPHEGSRETPPHKFSDFRWKDYCPKVFEKLRSLFVVDPGEYMLSICGEQALRELSSPGKSGALFYISHDDRYLIKTMRRNEMKTFISMLPYYFDHVQSNPHTLVTKFYGLYRIKLHSNKSNNRKIRFVVMGNVFNSEVSIHQKYDLKGSTHGRFTKDKSKASIWKDCDLDVELQLMDDWKDRLDRQLSEDANFLRKQHVMDYSLLMGIHYKNREQTQQTEIAGQKAVQELAAAKKTYLQKIVSWKLPDAQAKDVVFIVHTQLRRKQRRFQSFYSKNDKTDQNDELAFQLGEKRVQLGVGMQAKAIHKASKVSEDVVVYFGIIDFLQEYSSVKWAEHAIKSLRYDGNTVSVVDPDTYANRFTSFMRQKVFQ